MSLTLISLTWFPPAMELPIQDLETNPHCQLKGARSSRAKNLWHSVHGLPEHVAGGQISAVPHQVSFVVQVEHLADQR